MCVLGFSCFIISKRTVDSYSAYIIKKIIKHVQRRLRVDMMGDEILNLLLGWKN